MQICHLSPPIGIHGEKTLERIHALSEALGVIEPVDSDDHGAAGEAVHHIAHKRRAHGTAGKPAELVGLDADWKDSDSHGPLGAPESIATALLQAALVFQITREIGGVVLSLEAHEIVSAQLRDQPFVIGQRREYLRRREWDVEEKPDRIAMAAIAQHLRQRDEMVIVHPDHVVGSQPIVDLGGKERVHSPVAAEVAAREFRKVETVMQDGPQDPIGEAVVVFLIVRRREIRHDIRKAAFLDGAGSDVLVRRYRPAPAEPQTAVALEQGTNGDGQAPGLIGAVPARDCYSIRNDDQPRQYRSSQLRDNRMAVKISPAIE